MSVSGIKSEHRSHILSLCSILFFSPISFFNVCVHQLCDAHFSLLGMNLLSLSFLYIDIPKFFNSSLCKLFYWTHLYERNSLSSTCHIANHFWMSFLDIISILRIQFPIWTWGSNFKALSQCVCGLGDFQCVCEIF